MLFALPVVESHDTEHDDSKDRVLSGMYWNINLPGIGEDSKVEPYIMNYQQVQDNGSYNMFGCIRTCYKTHYLELVDSSLCMVQLLNLLQFQGG